MDKSDKTVHILLRLTDSALTPIGTIRGYKVSDYYKLTRLAVLKEYRRYRFGATLVQSLHDWVKKDAFDKAKAATELESLSSSPASVAYAQIVCHSQIPVKGFYAKFGYEPQGEEFDEDGDPHQKMVLRMKL